MVSGSSAVVVGNELERTMFRVEIRSETAPPRSETTRHATTVPCTASYSTVVDR